MSESARAPGPAVDAEGDTWRIRASGEAGVFFFARPLPHVAGETRRMAHLFRVPRARVRRLTAYCGFQIDPADAELLSRPSGMPCERCLVLAAKLGQSRRVPLPRRPGRQG